MEVGTWLQNDLGENDTSKIITKQRLLWLW